MSQPSGTPTLPFDFRPMAGGAVLHLSFALTRICQRAAAGYFFALGHNLRGPCRIDNYRPRLIGSADNAAISRPD